MSLLGHLSMIGIGSKNQKFENNHYSNNNSYRKPISFFWMIFSRISRWTVILSIALILVTIIFSISIIAFAQSPAFDKNHLWISIGNYLTSDIFDKVLPTIIIPLVVFIWRIYDNNTKQKEQELKEKKKSTEQELKENRVRTIESTFEEWNKINKLVSEVRFLESNDIKKIEQVQLQIAEHSISSNGAYCSLHYL